MGGVRIQPDMTIDAISPVDSAMLILPGGDAWEQGENQAAIEKAAEFLAARRSRCCHLRRNPGLRAGRVSQ